MFKLIGRHWRGEANFWLTVILSIVLPIGIIAVGAQWVGIDALQDTPQCD